MQKEAYILEPDLSSWLLKPEHVNQLNKSESTVYVRKHEKEKDEHLTERQPLVGEVSAISQKIW
jgi:hypothetical protein